MFNPRMALRSPIINVMTKAALSAARTLVRDFGEVEQLQVSKKGPGDFVSAADKKSEATLIQELKRARPEYGFIIEEKGTLKGKDPENTWIIDPLDGTTNFLHGIPHFAISIGLQRKGEIIAGLIYNPITDEMFCCEKGYGSYLNERRLRASIRRDLDETIIALGIPHSNRSDPKKFQKEFENLSPHVGGFRRMGAASLDLAYVAAGRFDAYWERGLKPWDMAAGILMVKEAGGTVTDLDGKQEMLSKGSILAAPEPLHTPLVSLLNKD